jgi:hypothetical protein
LNTEKSVTAPEAIDLGTRLVRSPTLVYSAVDGEISMMNVETGKYYGLARVGARIWALLAEPTTVQTVCDRLMCEYRVDRASCEADVLRFVKHMAAEGVVATTPAE